MDCPKCKEEMEFEEAKNFHGIWICEECNYECDGNKIPIADGKGQLEYEEGID